MSKRLILFLGIAYALATFILHNILETTIGGFMMTISFLGLLLFILILIYSVIKFSIRQFIYNRKNRQ